jgi:hypothetical protein
MNTSHEETRLFAALGGPAARCAGCAGLSRTRPPVHQKLSPIWARLTSVGVALVLAGSAFAQTGETVKWERVSATEVRGTVGSITLCELFVALSITAAAASGGLYIYCTVRKRAESPYVCICPATLVLQEATMNLDGSVEWTGVQTNVISKRCNINGYVAFGLPWNGQTTNGGVFRVVVYPPPTNSVAF